MGIARPTAGVAGRSADLKGELVLLRPLGDEKVIDTEVGQNTARFCEALIVVGDDGKYRNLGETPIFWEVVRRQLNEANPWIAGRIQVIEGGRAYRLNPPTDDEYALCERVLKRHETNPIPVEKPTEDDEAPF